MGRAHSDRSLEPHADLGASTPTTLIAAASVPGASRPHSSLAHCPMSSNTVEATGATHLGTERAVIALVIATLPVIWVFWVTSIGAERLASVIQNGHNRWAVGTRKRSKSSRRAAEGQAGCPRRSGRAGERDGA